MKHKAHNNLCRLILRVHKDNKEISLLCKEITINLSYPKGPYIKKSFRQKIFINFLYYIIKNVLSKKQIV